MAETDRGVSDVISYVLVFSLIAASLATVSLAGLDSLQSARNAEQFQNAERAFDVFGENMQDIHARDAPGRVTEMKLNDAQLFLGDPVTMTVEVRNAGNPTYSTDIRPIVYTVEGSETKLVYAGGMQMRVEADGAVEQASPPLLFHEDTGASPPVRTVVIPFVQTRPSGSRSVGGETTAYIRADRILGETMASKTTPANATTDIDSDGESEYDVRYTVETTPARAPVWETYLDEQITWETDACSLTGGGTVECTFPTEHLYVTATRVNVELSA